MTESKEAEENAVILDVDRFIYSLFHIPHMLWDQNRYFILCFCNSAQTIPLIFCSKNNGNKNYMHDIKLEKDGELMWRVQDLR